MRPAGGAGRAVEPIPVPPSVSAYCRQARRLRGTFGRQPARMHRKLRELAANQRPAAAAAHPAAATRPAAIETSKARRFADRVEAALEGPVLRYATRRALMSEARRLGIGDFEANLIIAAVQHERRRAGPAGAATIERPGERRQGRLRSLGPAALVVAVESLLALGLWQVCWG